MANYVTKKPLLSKESLMAFGKNVKSNLSKNLSDVNYAQDFVPVKEIQDGLIITTDGRVLDIIEILPLNFSELSDFQKEQKAYAFGNSFKSLSENGQFKIMNVKINLSEYKERIRLATAKENNPKLTKRIEDYLSNIDKMQTVNASSKRFFYIFEYEGNENGEYSDNWEDIKRSMLQQQNDALAAFVGVGAAALPLQNDNSMIANVLYQFYNPFTSQKESLDTRINAVVKASAANNEPALMSDFLCPKGIRFGKYDYMAVDGMYQTFLVLKDIGFPMYDFPGWISKIVTYTDDADLDIFYRKTQSALTDFLVDRTEILNRSVLNFYNSSGDIDKQESLMQKSANAKFIKERIHDGEELHEVCIVVTLRNKTVEGLHATCKSFIKQAKRDGGYLFGTCFLNTEKYYRMVAPLNSVDKSIFNYNKRNMTNHSLESLYCFSTFELFDESGVCLGLIGKSAGEQTLYSFDPHMKKYVNPHILIAGMPGAGKSFTGQGLMSRLRMNGVTTMYILPMKGHEYRESIDSQGGVFIDLMPSSKACINICEIRPRAIYDERLKLDKEAIDEINNEPSLLAEKIQSITTWIKLLLGEIEYLTRDESAELNSVLTEVYKRKGITEDNSSIFNNDGSVKEMPILTDVYNGILEHKSLSRIAKILLPFITGTCRNFNGKTNIDLSNPCIAFNVDEDKIGEELLPAFMFMAFDYCYQVGKRDFGERCAIFIDEAWKFLKIKDCADYIVKMVRLLRSYKTSVVTATQSLYDYKKYGKELLAFTPTKILMRMSKEELGYISDSVSLSEENMDYLLSLPSGWGFLCQGQDCYLLKVGLSAWELYLYETDAEKKAVAKERWLAELHDESYNYKI